MVAHQSTCLFSPCNSCPHGKKPRNGLHLDGFAGLLVAIVVEPVLFVPKYLVYCLRKLVGAIGIHSAVGGFAYLLCNHLHRLKFPDEVAREVHAFIAIGLKVARSGDLVVHPARVGAIPDRQPVSIMIVGKPSVDVPLESSIVVSSQPLIIVAVLTGTQDDKLREEG